jgi:hypothetical protein
VCLRFRSLSYSSALYTIYLTWYQSHFSCGLQYSGIPASSSALHPAAALFRPTAPSMRYSRSSFGAPSDGRPSPANRAANSSGNFCPSLSRRHRHPSRPKEPPTVVSKPPDRWICAISAYSGVARVLRSSPNDRSDAPSPDPKRSPPSKLPRAYTRHRKDLPFADALSRALPW